MKSIRNSKQHLTAVNSVIQYPARARARTHTHTVDIAVKANNLGLIDLIGTHNLGFKSSQVGSARARERETGKARKRERDGQLELKGEIESKRSRLFF